MRVAARITRSILRRGRPPNVTHGSAMSRLSVRLLGAARIEVGRTAIETDTRKATALLSYLAVSAQPQRRATLAALFWPDTDDQKARGALRRTLSVLRSALGDRWLQSE